MFPSDNYLAGYASHTVRNICRSSHLRFEAFAVVFLKPSLFLDIKRRR
jgi:hypothetical protein